ncbi:hypothetical protein JVX98_31825 (plasmid) [Ensifer sp. PDNC004]|uniref:hypothetical protein n=1 Tax=unclassified Ensifer TaxID=2633371 RepID=UPI00177F4652|nr:MULTISPECIES: hypothetical protein [unclassified Ensifer]MBD9650274.1 hypothetical protein [Ensifer sp. ENS09]QRY70622.1 hypothetical protein JVX98_31825 [Ensifer sp. PDNC004]
MSDSQTISFYSAIRNDREALGRLAAAKSESELIELILDEARTRNCLLEVEQIRAGLANLGSLVGKAAGNDELRDFELELVSGGVESAREQWERAKKANGACW